MPQMGWGGQSLKQAAWPAWLSARALCSSVSGIVSSLLFPVSVGSSASGTGSGEANNSSEVCHSSLTDSSMNESRDTSGTAVQSTEGHHPARKSKYVLMIFACDAVPCTPSALLQACSLLSLPCRRATTRARQAYVHLDEGDRLHLEGRSGFYLVHLEVSAE